MIKNLSILITGILIGMGSMFFFYTFRDLQEENSSLRMSTGKGDSPEFNLDPLYDKLMKEKQVQPDVDNWFEEELNKLDANTQSQTDKMKSEGDESAKMFEQFSKPAKE